MCHWNSLFTGPLGYKTIELGVVFVYRCCIIFFITLTRVSCETQSFQVLILMIFYSTMILYISTFRYIILSSCFNPLCIHTCTIKAMLDNRFQYIGINNPFPIPRGLLIPRYWIRNTTSPMEFIILYFLEINSPNGLIVQNLIFAQEHG